MRGYHGSGFYPSTDNNAYFLGENLRASITKIGEGTMSALNDGGGTTEDNDGNSQDAGRGEEGQSYFEVVYPTAALVVMQRFPATERGAMSLRGQGTENVEAESENEEDVMQRFFNGHSDDVTAIAVHPEGVIVASGQVQHASVWRTSFW